MNHPHILIEIKGGCIQRVTATEEILLSIIDRDNISVSSAEESQSALTSNYSQDTICSYLEIQRIIKSEIQKLKRQKK